MYCAPNGPGRSRGPLTSFIWARTAEVVAAASAARFSAASAAALSSLAAARSLSSSDDAWEGMQHVQRCDGVEKTASQIRPALMI